MLDHVKNSVAGRNLYEPVVQSLFRVTFIPPTSLGDAAILSEHCQNISGFKIPGPEAIQQQHGTARRNYASVEVDNTQNLTMSFSLNLNDEYQNYIFNFLQDWRSLVFDPVTGTRGLKKDYVGKAIIESYSRDGQIYWERTVHNFWPSADFSGALFDNDITSHDPAALDSSWIADYYTEKRP